MNLLIPLILTGAGLMIMSSNNSSKSSSSSNISNTKPRVGLYKSYGVSEISFNAGKDLFASQSNNITSSILSASDIRNGALNNTDVVVFLGGSGSQQGKDLQDKGRQIVREYVWNGGNYIGVCGGAYLALQGAAEFNKLNMVAGRNYGDYWKRGLGPCDLKTNDGKKVILHYENGPVFDRVNVENIPPFVELAKFESDFYIKSQGTNPGEMPGRPAIIISQFGKGKILLFSPNPIIGTNEELHPQMMMNGIRWLANNSIVSQNLKFTQVFGNV